MSAFVENDNNESDKLHISLHAMSGFMNPQTMQFTGFVGNHFVQELVDRGSMHNFHAKRSLQ